MQLTTIRHTFGALASALLLLCLAGPQPAQASDSSPASSHRERILFVGASVTSGWFATDSAHAFPQVLVRELRQHGTHATATVLAVPETTAAEMLEWKFPRRQDVIVVHAVTDDFMFDTPLAQYRRSYHRLLALLHAGSPHAQLVCLGDWMWPNLRNHIHVLSRTYSSVVQRECEHLHGRYVDLSAIFERPDVHGPLAQVTQFGRRDWFHPNNRGHSLIAHQIYISLQPNTLQLSWQSQYLLALRGLWWLF